MWQVPRATAGPAPASPGRRIERRWLLAAMPAAAGMILTTHARADADVPELALLCDTTLGPAMRAAGTAYASVTGVRIVVFATDPGLILPQLERQVQNDIVVTERSIMDAAMQEGVVAKDATRGGWRDSVVIAAKRGAPSMRSSPIAVCDPTPASDMDGPAILARLGMLPTPMLGVIDTDSVVALVLDGTARAGVMHMTDVRANPALQVLSTVPDAIQPAVSYAAAVTKLARRPHPGRFIEFLTGTQTTALLASLGLESAT